MVVVHKFLHDEYNVDNKVVFQNTPTSVLPWRWWQPDCRARNPRFDRLKNCQICNSGEVELLKVWCSYTLIYTTNSAEITPHITLIRRPLLH
jgi:hypothetical protein